MKAMKKLLALTLSICMIVQISASAFAVGLGSKKDSFKYVALGDSVAAGFGMNDGSVIVGDTFKIMNVNQNYNSSPVGCYPQVVGTALQETLVSQGYLENKSQFTLSNLGTSTFMMKDFVETMSDPDHMSDFFAAMVKPYENQYNSYLADPAAFKANYLASQKTSQLNRAKSYVSAYLAAAAGSTEETTALNRMKSRFGLDLTTLGDKAAVTTWYGDGTGSAFTTWFDGWFAAKYTDAYFDSYIATLKKNASGIMYKFHDLYVQELSSADLITVNIGSNDLLEQLMFDMSAKGTDSTTGEMKNPIFYMLWNTLFSLMCGNPTDQVFDTLDQQIDQYSDQITVQDVLDVVEYANPVNISGQLLQYAGEAADQYPGVIEGIKKLNDDVQMAFVGCYSSFGSDLTCDGVTYNASTVYTIINTIVGGALEKDAAELGKFVAGDMTEDELKAKIETYKATIDALKAAASDPTQLVNAIPVNSELYQTLVSILYQLQYPIQFFVMGVPSIPAIKYLNLRVEQYAAQYSVPYVDIYGIPNENNMNPHPTVAGHKYIADQIIDTLINTVTVAENENCTVQLSTTKAVLSTTVSLTAQAKTGYKLGAVTATDTSKKELTMTKGANSTYSFVMPAADVTVQANTLSIYDKVYTGMGDSITAGYSLNDYTGDFCNPSQCYVNLVGTALSMNETYNLGLPALTSDELLEILDDPQSPYYERFVEDVTTSNLITVQIGINDLNMRLLDELFAVLGVKSGSMTREQRMAIVKPFLHGATLEDVMANLKAYFGTTVSASDLQKMLQVMSKSNLDKIFGEEYAEFQKNWPKLIARIHEINGDAKVIAVGAYNANTDLSFIIGGSSFDLNDVYEKYVKLINQTLYGQKDAYNYLYVDTNGVQVYSTINKLDIDPHPTVYGHKLIADRILGVYRTGVSMNVGATTVTKPVSKPVYYNIDVQTVGNGTVSPGSSVYRKSSDQTFTFTPASGYQVSEVYVDGVKVAAANSYTFTNLQSAHTLKVVFASTTPAELPFTDVSKADWFYKDVAYVYTKNLMKGTSDTTFAPYLSTTRGMIVTILYRLEGSPAVTGTCPFSDVTSGSYYENAITWAAAHKIVEGYGSGKFGPEDNITREQLAAILYRYCQYKGYDVSVGEDTNILSYNDAFSISEYAIPAMQWACGAEIIQGSGNNLLPKNAATRAQVAAMIHRFCNTYVK